VPIVDTAIVHIYFKVSRKGLARAGKGLIPPHSHPTQHTHCLSPTITRYIDV